MKIKAYLQLIVAAIVPIVLSSCASTQVSHIWRDPSFVSGPMKNLLVVAVRKNQSTRRAWENGFTATLSEYGVKVTPSYHLFAESLPDTVLIKTVAKEQSFDGIILVGRASTKTEVNVTPEMNLNAKFPSQPWDGWYYTYYNQEYYPGYPMENEIVKDEITLWTMKGGGRMVWSGVGEVQDSGTREDVRDEIIHIIVSELVKQGVVAAGL